MWLFANKMMCWIIRTLCVVWMPFTLECVSYSPAQAHTHTRWWWDCKALAWPLGVIVVQFLAKGHFDTCTDEARELTDNMLSRSKLCFLTSSAKQLLHYDIIILWWHLNYDIRILVLNFQNLFFKTTVHFQNPQIFQILIQQWLWFVLSVGLLCA